MKSEGKQPDADRLARPLWGIAAFVVLGVVMAAAAPRLTGDADREAGRLRAFEGLAMARGVAGVVEANGDANALATAAAALQATDPTVRRVFYLTEGGVDDLGLPRDREFAFDTAGGRHAIRPDDKDLVDVATRISGKLGDKGFSGLEPKELVRYGDIGPRRRFVTFAPAIHRAAGGTIELLGMVGVERETERWPIASHLLYGLGLALLATFVFVGLLSWRRAPRALFAAVAAVVLVVGGLLAWSSAGGAQERVAAAQVRALANARAALDAGAPGAPFDPELAWKLTWPDPATRCVTPAPGGFGLDEAATAARARGRLVFPGVLTILGLLLAFVALRGTARLVHGVCHQPATYLYMLPIFAAMGALIFFPFLKGVEFAFLDKNAGDFVGLANFADTLLPSATSNSSFYRTLLMTVIWTVLNVTLHVSIGLGLALLLNNPKLRFKGIYRVLLVVPWAVPSYITALTWKTMFNLHYGAVNLMLESVGIAKIDWLGQSVVANFGANLITNVWLGFPFMMVVALGALQSIPGELYEAADIDGANRWQKFRRITLPLLKPALFPAIILGTIWTFNQFNVIYLVSGGGPNHQTDILITEAYYLFKVLGQYGQAAAYCIVIFLILLVYTVMTNRITKATEGAFD